MLTFGVENLAKRVQKQDSCLRNLLRSACTDKFTCACVECGTDKDFFMVPNIRF